MSDLSFTHQIVCYLLAFSPVCSAFPDYSLLPFHCAYQSEIAWLSKIIFEVPEHFFTNKVLKSLSISAFKSDIGITVWCFRRKLLPCFCFLWFLAGINTSINLIYLSMFYLCILLSSSLLWAQFSVLPRRMKSNICESSIKLYETQKHWKSLQYNTNEHQTEDATLLQYVLWC